MIYPEEKVLQMANILYVEDKSKEIEELSGTLQENGYSVERTECAERAML